MSDQVMRVIDRCVEWAVVVVILSSLALTVVATVREMARPPVPRPPGDATHAP